MHIAHMQTIRRNLIWVGWELAHNSFTISATNWTVSFSNKKTIRCNSISTGRCTRKLGSFVIHSKHPERWLKKLHTVLWELENLIFGKLGEVGNVMIHNSCETWFFHQNFLKIIYDAKQDIGTPPIQPVSHSRWWKWQKHGREAMHDREGLLLINKQPNKAEPGVINVLHSVALHSAGWDRALVTAWLQNWRRIQMKMRERWRPTSISVQSSPAPWSFSLSLQLFFSQFSSHPLQSNRAQRPDAVRSHETGLFEIITNPDLRSHPVPLTCRAPSCMSHLNRPLSGYRHCCRCFLCHRFDTFDPTPVWLWCHVTR